MRRLSLIACLMLFAIALFSQTEIDEESLIKQKALAKHLLIQQQLAKDKEYKLAIEKAQRQAFIDKIKPGFKGGIGLNLELGAYNFNFERISERFSYSYSLGVGFSYIKYFTRFVALEGDLSLFGSQCIYSYEESNVKIPIQNSTNFYVGTLDYKTKFNIITPEFSAGIALNPARAFSVGIGGFVSYKVRTTENGTVNYTGTAYDINNNYLSSFDEEFARNINHFKNNEDLNSEGYFPKGISSDYLLKRINAGISLEASYRFGIDYQSAFGIRYRKGLMDITQNGYYKQIANDNTTRITLFYRVYIPL